jgi:hypothetical protein
VSQYYPIYAVNHTTVQSGKELVCSGGAELSQNILGTKQKLPELSLAAPLQITALQIVLVTALLLLVQMAVAVAAKSSSSCEQK